MKMNDELVKKHYNAAKKALKMINQTYQLCRYHLPHRTDEMKQNIKDAQQIVNDLKKEIEKRQL